MMEPTERVTLVVGEDRVEVSREDITSRSAYFAALFSPNFKDYLNSEHRINYDININTLKTFVAWVSDHKYIDDGDHHRVRPTLTKFLEDQAAFGDLLKLLRLSVIFIVESLIKELTELIIRHWLIPQKSVQIWLLAKELGLNTLRDLAKAVCVVHLQHVQEYSLLALSGEDFSELVGNIHVKITPEFPYNLVQQWIQHNVLDGARNPFETSYPFTIPKDGGSKLDEMYENQYWKQNIQCIVGHKQTPDNEVRTCIFGWDGNTFSEIIELRSCPIWTENLTGSRIVGQGFDIYIVGGKFKGQRRKYQKEIWRYSMITRLWNFVTRMPTRRKHMGVTVMGEKIFILGCTQSSSPYYSTVDVYNIDTEEWLNAASVPPWIGSDSVMWIHEGSLTLYDEEAAHTYTYIEKTNQWQRKLVRFIGFQILRDGRMSSRYKSLLLQFVKTIGSETYVVGYYNGRGRNSADLKIFRVEARKEHQHLKSHSSARFVGNCKTLFENQVGSGPYLIGFSHCQENGTIFVEVIELNGAGVKSRYIHKETRPDVRDFCHIHPIGCFNVFNPKSLNQLFDLKENAM